jgi:uncharacterized protein (TIRG00374 family)
MKRKYLGTLIAAAVLVAMVGYLATQRDALAALREIPVWMAVVIAGASLIVILAQSLQFSAAAIIHGCLIPLRESVGLTAANIMANYYLPARGGMVVRAAYMKRVYRLPLPQYAALSVLMTGLSIAVAAILGIAGVIILLVSDGSVEGRAIITFTGLGLASLGGMGLAIFVSGKIRSEGRFAEVARGFRSGADLWFHSRSRLYVFLGWTVALFAAQALRLWLSFAAVGITPDFGSMLTIQAMALVAFVLALTPGNIGLKEGAIVFAASLLGIDPNLALLASLIDRAASLLVTFVVGLVNVRYLTQRATKGAESESESPQSQPEETKPGVEGTG